MYSAKELLPLLSKIHAPNNNIWCYSGFTLNEIQANPDMAALLDKCTHLIDGMFDITKRDVTLRFRGSSNQTIWEKNNGQWIPITKKG